MTPLIYQHIGMDDAAELVGKLFEVMQVELVVLFAVETDGAVVAAPNDVPGDAGEGQAGATGHFRPVLYIRVSRNHFGFSRHPDTFTHSVRKIYSPRVRQPHAVYNLLFIINIMKQAHLLHYFMHK